MGRQYIERALQDGTPAPSVATQTQNWKPVAKSRIWLNNLTSSKHCTLVYRLQSLEGFRAYFHSEEIGSSGPHAQVWRGELGTGRKRSKGQDLSGGTWKAFL